jgi:dephospho-CoA kinase
MNIHDLLKQNNAISTPAVSAFSMEALLQAQHELHERLAADLTGEDARAHAQALYQQRSVILQELQSLIEQTQKRKMTSSELQELTAQVEEALLVIQTSLPQDWAHVQAMKRENEATADASKGAPHGT